MRPFSELEIRSRGQKNFHRFTQRYGCGWQGSCPQRTQKPGKSIAGPRPRPRPRKTSVRFTVFQKERSVFVLDGTLFHWRGRLIRVNEELAYLTHAVSDKLQPLDLEALESDWKIHPVVEEAEDEEEGIPPDLEEDEDLDDLPFDTATRS